MSVVRLIMTEENLVSSGLIPSASISSVLWAISVGAESEKTLWKLVDNVDPTLAEHFNASRDALPVLEGFDDGLFVVSFNHRCIESFQVYQPIMRRGSFLPHDGVSLLDLQEPIEFEISDSWSLTDHHFEESRH